MAELRLPRRNVAGALGDTGVQVRKSVVSRVERGESTIGKGEQARDGMVVARYGWRTDPGQAAGEMHVTPSDDPDKIAKLVVTFQQGLG